MKKIFLSLIFICFFVLATSCGGGSSNDCEDGYKWDGSECVKDNTVVDSDPDVSITDDDIVADDTNDTDDLTDIENDAENDADTAEYTGDCTQIKEGDTYTINIQTKTLTIGSLTVNGTENDSDLTGELWAGNTATLGEFKIADITTELKQKTFQFPVGTYNFYFKLTSSGNKVTLLENIAVSSDTTIDINVPLYHFTGSVVKNGSSMTIDSAMEASTFIELESGSYKFTIPYENFSSFDILVPAGTYSVYFEGQLSSGKGLFKGTVLSSDDGIVVSDNIDQQINIQTVTYSGNAVNEGYDVSTGQLVLVENPPFSDMSTIIIPDLASKSYSVEITTGAQLSVLYLPEADSYPARYIKIETFTDVSSSQSHDITLDFGRIYGTITFLGGTNLPSLSKCTEADCSRGKLKVVGYDSSTYLIKDFGMEGTDMTYDGLILRRTKTNEETQQYNPKSYSMSFESYLNNVTEAFSYTPFTMSLSYINGEGTSATQFNFLNVDESYMTEKQINFNIAPMVVTGTVKLDGTAITTETSDFIKVKDEDNIETPVINLSDLTDGTFSFMVPEGDYEVIYEGEGILGIPFKTYIDRGFTVNSNITDHSFNLTTAKIYLGFTVNGKSFKEWASENENIDNYEIVINPDKTAASYGLEVVDGDTPYGIALAGNTVNIFLNIFMKNKYTGDPSFTRVPLVLADSLTSDKTIKDIALSFTPFSTVVTLNGKAISGASDYIAIFKISGNNKTQIYYPADGAATEAMFKSGEQESPRPEIELNDGFDTKQSIKLDCLYFGE